MSRQPQLSRSGPYEVVTVGGGSGHAAAAISADLSAEDTRHAVHAGQHPVSPEAETHLRERGMGDWRYGV